MKRVMLVLLGLLCALNLAAQNRQSRIQQVMAIQEMQAEGLSAAHPTLPIGSKVRIRNPANALTIEATIIEQLPGMDQQVIDLSPAAALALDIGAGGPVIVTTLSQASPASSNARQKTDGEMEAEPEKSSLPFNITINNYITNPDKPNVAPDRPAPAEDAQNRPIRENPPEDTKIEPAISGQNGEAPIAVSEPVVQQPVTPVQPPAQVAAQPAVQPPVTPVQPPAQVAAQSAIQPPVQQPVTPIQPPAQVAAAQAPVQPPAQTGEPSAKEPLYAPPVYNWIPPTLPDPRSTKKYRLLVETCPSIERANLVYRQLDKAGFKVALEQAGNMCSVFAADIPAAQVYYAAQRLGAIGFGQVQVWIQE